jgi:hypothetical protein
VAPAQEATGRSGLGEAEPNRKKEGRIGGSLVTLHGRETGAAGALRGGGGEEEKWPLERGGGVLIDEEGGVGLKGGGGSWHTWRRSLCAIQQGARGKLTVGPTAA